LDVFLKKLNLKNQLKDRKKIVIIVIINRQTERETNTLITILRFPVGVGVIIGH